MTLITFSNKSSIKIQFQCRVVRANVTNNRFNAIISLDAISAGKGV